MFLEHPHTNVVPTPFPRGYAEAVGRITAMAWLRFGFPLEEELEVEKQARAIRDCDDIDRLREFAEQVFRAWVQQSDIVAQLIPQVAEAEATLAQLGFCDEPDPEYLRWARELYPDRD